MLTPYKRQARSTTTSPPTATMACPFTHIEGDVFAGRRRANLLGGSLSHPDRIGSMTSTGLSRSAPLGFPGGRLLALLLVGVLLLCHGVFGALHLCPASQVSASQVHEHHSPAETGAADLEHSACHLTSDAYFGVLLFTVFLGLLLGGAWLWSRVNASRPFERRFRPLVLHPPRGPTAPLVGVFR